MGSEARPELREALADYAHQAWSGWMRYLFSKCINGPDYSMLIPSHLKTRWYRQVDTDYSNLPDEEKESDRQEADRMLAIVLEHGCKHCPINRQVEG